MSFIAPALPETAPFSPSQRAWLDGFIAGLLSDSSHGPDASGSPPGEPEDFPWHDPGLSLDERIALAAGRRPERVLMAAMAQTDCGQCGYSCQAYAEAIASGADGNIGRCTPGGKATSRKLKELLGGMATLAATAVLSTPALAAGPAASPAAGPAQAPRFAAAAE